MRPFLRLAIAFAVLSIAAPSLAQAEGRLTALGGEPPPQGVNLIHAQFGWPGISATFLHGSSPKVAMGGRFSLNYGLEGQLGGLTGGLNLGLKFQGLIRVGLLDTGRVNLGLDLAPGLAIYFLSGNAAQIGVALPLALVLGIPLGEALTLHAALEMPMLVTFTWYSTFYLPIYFGGGLEYALDRNILLTVALRAGPMIDARQSTANTGVLALFGLAFKL